MEHHSLDPYPIPKDKKPLYINEPWLIDKSLLEYEKTRRRIYRCNEVSFW